MKKIILSISSLVVVLLLLSGCFILGPTIKVSGLVSDFEKYWEAENSVELAGLYTNPAVINTATKSYSRSSMPIQADLKEETSFTSTGRATLTLI